MKDPADSKTVVLSVRFAPAEMRKVKEQAKALGVPIGRLVHMATLRLLGVRTDLDKMKAIAGALENVKPL